MGKQAAQDQATDTTQRVKAEKKARRRLAKAQLAWNVAQEECAQARVKGKQAVNKARLKEARLLAKASQRLERKAAAVAEAEEHLFSLIGANLEDGADHSPEAAQDLLQHLADAPGSGDGPRPMTAVETTEPGRIGLP